MKTIKTRMAQLTCQLPVDTVVALKKYAKEHKKANQKVINESIIKYIKPC